MDPTDIDAICALFDQSKSCRYLLATSGKLKKENGLKAKLAFKQTMRFKGADANDLVRADEPDYVYVYTKDINEEDSVNVDEKLRNINLKPSDKKEEIETQIINLDVTCDTHQNLHQKSIHEQEEKLSTQPKTDSSEQLIHPILSSKGSEASSVRQSKDSENVDEKLRNINLKPSDKKEETETHSTNMDMTCKTHQNLHQKSRHEQEGKLSTQSETASSEKSICPILSLTESEHSSVRQSVVLQENANDESVNDHVVDTFMKAAKNSNIKFTPEQLNFLNEVVVHLNVNVTKGKMSHEKLKRNDLVAPNNGESDLNRTDNFTTNGNGSLAGKRSNSNTSPASKKLKVVDQETNEPMLAICNIKESNYTELTQTWNLVNNEMKRRNTSKLYCLLVNLSLDCSHEFVFYIV